MAYTGKILAEGQLAATKTTIYTVPALSTAYVKFFRIFNTGAVAETVKIYFKRTVSRQLDQYVLAVSGWAKVIDFDETFILEAGDQIEAETTTVNEVDFVISGVVKT